MASLVVASPMVASRVVELLDDWLASGFGPGSELLAAGSGVDVGESVGLLDGSELLGGIEAEVGALELAGLVALVGGAAVVPPGPLPVAE